MGYKKQNFYKGQTLTHDHLNYIEEGISLLSTGGSAEIITKEFGYAEICDGFYVTASGTQSSKIDGFGMTDYEYCHKALSLTVRMITSLSGATYGLAFYDEKYKYITNSYIAAPENDSVYYVDQSIEIPEGAYYFRTSYYDYKASQEKGFFKYVITFAKDDYDFEYRPYRDGFIYFSQQVDQTPINTTDTTAATAMQPNFKSATGVLALPKTYSPNGKNKTPLILYSHGSSHYVYYGKWGNTENFRKQKQNWLDAGFAVMGCSGPFTNFGAYINCGVPQAINAWHACVQYICENYNIDPYIFVVGASAGSITAFNYSATVPEVRATIIIDPNIYGIHYWSGWRDAIDTYLHNPAEDWKSIAPENRIITINNTKYYLAPFNTPIYWMVEPDVYTLENVKEIYGAMKNSGYKTFLKYFDGYTHSQLCSGGDLISDFEITNWFRQFISYPIGLKDGVSSGSAPKYYTITGNISNGYLSGDTSIKEDSTATLYINNNVGYMKPKQLSDISITGGTISSYDNGTLIIENPTDNIVITASCEIDNREYTDLTATAITKAGYVYSPNSWSTSGVMDGKIVDVSSYSGKELIFTFFDYSMASGGAPEFYYGFRNGAEFDTSSAVGNAVKTSAVSGYKKKGNLKVVNTIIPEGATHLYTSFFNESSLTTAATEGGGNVYDGTLEDFYVHVIIE